MSVLENEQKHYVNVKYQNIYNINNTICVFIFQQLVELGKYNSRYHSRYGHFYVQKYGRRWLMKNGWSTTTCEEHVEEEAFM